MHSSSAKNKLCTQTTKAMEKNSAASVPNEGTAESANEKPEQFARDVFQRLVLRKPGTAPSVMESTLLILNGRSIFQSQHNSSSNSQC